MFDGFDQFDQAFMQESINRGHVRAAPPLRRRRTIKQVFSFYVANLIVMPIVGLVYASIIADGIRLLLPIFRRRLYQLPIPGAGLARNFDGWDRADLAIVVSILLFGVITWLWCKIWIELMGYGSILAQRERNPMVFMMLSVIAGVILLLDAGIFYYGLAAQTSSGWSNAPEFIVPAATLIYACGLAVLGWWHADYHTSNLT